MLKDNLNEISVISNKDANERALSLIPKIKDIKCNIKSSDTNVSPDIIDLPTKRAYLDTFSQGNGVVGSWILKPGSIFLK